MVQAPQLPCFSGAVFGVGPAELDGFAAGAPTLVGSVELGGAVTLGVELGAEVGLASAGVSEGTGGGEASGGSCSEETACPETPLHQTSDQVDAPRVRQRNA